MSRTVIRTVRVLGTLLAVLLVLVAARSATAQASRHSETTTHELSPGLTAVELVNGVGDVTVRAVAPGERPRVVVTATGGFLDPSVEVAEVDDTASLAADCPSNIWFGPCDVRWRLHVPADVAVSLVTAVGDVTVIGTSGTVRAEASVGQVVALDVGGSVIELQSSVGDVLADVAVPPSRLSATTSTGDVLVTVPGGGTAYRVRATTSIGTVTNEVRSDPGSDHSLSLLTSIGDVTVRPG